MTERSSSLVFLIAALALVPFMPSTDSIWVDEAQTWRYARHDSLQQFVKEFRNDRSSETQMPLGMGLAWAWARVIGTSEWALRAPNMLYAAGAIVCFFYVGRREKMVFMPLFLAIQPFLWYYVNEARPYALQIFGGSLLLLAVYHAFKTDLRSPKWAIFWGFGALISAASSLLGVIPVAAASALIVMEARRKQLTPSPIQAAVIICVVVMLVALGAYYTKSLLAGSGGAKIWDVGLRNLLLSFAEFMGFAGLLPPRQEVRDAVRAGFSTVVRLDVLVLPILLSGLYVALGLKWLSKARQTPIWMWACFIILLIGSGTLMFASIGVGFPFWGRHLAPLFPFFAVITGWITCMAWRSSVTWRLASFTYIILLFVSSLFIRCSKAHAKDDYRAAAQVALQSIANEQIVWWAADPPAANYYIPQIKCLTEEGVLVLTFGANAVTEKLRPNPGVIIISKPDLYDPNGDIRTRARLEDLYPALKLKSFTIWTKQ